MYDCAGLQMSSGTSEEAAKAPKAFVPGKYVANGLNKYVFLDFLLCIQIRDVHSSRPSSPSQGIFLREGDRF